MNIIDQFKEALASSPITEQEVKWSMRVTDDRFVDILSGAPMTDDQEQFVIKFIWKEKNRAKKLPDACEVDDCDSRREGATKFCGTHNKAFRTKEINDAKPKKEYNGISKIGTTNVFYSSDGRRHNQQQVNAQITKCYASMDEEAGQKIYYCSAYPGLDDIIDHDHTVAKARCKVLRKTELIWDPENIVYSSRKAHKEWESYQSGEFIKHKNFETRMAFTKLHDPEGFEKRMQVVAAFTKPQQTI